MTYPKAIVISVALIAASIAFAAYQPAQSALGSSGGRYMLGEATLDRGGAATWTIDTKTGEVRLCVMGKGKDDKLTILCPVVQKKW